MLIQSAFRPFKTVALAGAEFRPEAVAFNDSTWLEGSYQRYADRDFSKSYGFREWMVRSYNQLLFTCWGECNPQVVLGKEGYLFERGYWDAVSGKDYLGWTKAQGVVDSVVALNDLLKSRGKHLVVMVAPNKWRYHRDKLPADMQNFSDSTNYAILIPRLRSAGVHVMDWIAGFQNLRSDEPLFSKQGSHWSIMGGARAAYMLNGSLHARGLTQNAVRLMDIETVNEPRNTDKDLHDLMNLLEGPDEEKLAYPEFEASDVPGPRTLVIGDSYYWTFYYLGLHGKMFAPGSKFFYYNTTMVEDKTEERTAVTPSMLKEEIETSQVVLLVMGEPSLSRFGFGFLSQARQALNPHQ